MEDWYEITLDIAPGCLEEAEGMLVMLGAEAWETRSPAQITEFLEKNEDFHDYVDESLLKNRGEQLVLYWETDDLLPGLRARAAQTGAVTGVTVKRFAPKDWSAAHRPYFRTFSLGRLQVVPVWEKAPATGLTLLVDPGGAFGTGAHATTYMCLSLLEKLRLQGQNVLDVGTGSGILAMASLLLGADSARGTDIDNSAVAVALQGAALNGLANRAVFEKGNLLEGEKGRYGVICANIVADIILRLLPEIPARLLPGGSFICSGILCERLAEVLAALKANGMALAALYCREGWAALRAEPVKN